MENYFKTIEEKIKKNIKLEKLEIILKKKKKK